MSPTRSKAKSHEILVRQDRSRRQHFATSPTVTSSILVFENFQKLVLEHGRRELSPAARVLACLLAFDSIARLQDAEQAYMACKGAERWAGRVRIAWSTDGHVDARTISDMTIVTLTETEQWPSYIEVAREVERFTCLRLENPATLLGIVESGTMWLQLHLPGVLFGHVLQTAPMTALGPMEIARERTRRALLTRTHNTLSAELRTIDRLAARAAEAAMLGRAPSVFGGARFLAELNLGLRPPTHGSNAAKRASILGKLSALAAKLDDEDEVVAAIFGYALDLHTNGTVGKRELAPGTPGHYVSSFGERLRTLMIGESFQRIKEDDYVKIYKTLMRSGGPVAPYMVAGLKGFHRFLRQWLNVPPLPAEIFGMVDVVVEANVIWPHELNRVFEWLSKAPKSRLVSQLEVALAIGANGMIRINELLLLRMKNIISHDEVVEVEIAREIRDGKEKSAEGRRRLRITDPFARGKICDWVTRRSGEVATTEDYLFGEPANPSVVAHRGQMQVWLNKLLKTATGDPDVSFHTLRHTIVTGRVNEILCHPKNNEVSELDLLANEAGHAGGHTTCRYYAHRFEDALRLSVDRALSTRSLAYATFEKWSGLSQATLRQRVSRERKRSNPLGVLWASVAQRAVNIQLKPRVDLFMYGDPLNPLLELMPESLQLRQIIGALSDVASRHSLAAVDLRNDLGRKEIEAILHAVGRFADRHGERVLGMPDFLSAGVDALHDSSGRRLGLTPDFRRTRQVRWQKLVKAMSRCEPDQLAMALHYWQAGLHNRHLTMSAAHGLGPFIELIKQAGISAGQLALFWAPAPGEKASSVFQLDAIQSTVRATLGNSISVHEKSYRAGRPAIWLVVNSTIGAPQTEGSANSIVGLHCVMFAAHIWQFLQDTKREEVV